MSAKLSSTLAGMALLKFPFLLLLLGPFLGQRLVARLALDDSPPAPNERSSHRFEENSFRRRLNDCLCPVLDLELFAEAKRDHHLPFRREPDGLGFFSHIHRDKYDLWYKVRQ